MPWIAAVGGLIVGVIGTMLWLRNQIAEKRQAQAQKHQKALLQQEEDYRRRIQDMTQSLKKDYDKRLLAATEEHQVKVQALESEIQSLQSDYQSRLLQATEDLKQAHQDELKATVQALKQEHRERVRDVKQDYALQFSDEGQNGQHHKNAPHYGAYNGSSTPAPLYESISQLADAPSLLEVIDSSPSEPEVLSPVSKEFLAFNELENPSAPTFILGQSITEGAEGTLIAESPLDTFNADDIAELAAEPTAHTTEEVTLFANPFTDNDFSDFSDDATTQLSPFNLTGNAVDAFESAVVEPSITIDDAQPVEAVDLDFGMDLSSDSLIEPYPVEPKLDSEIGDVALEPEASVEIAALESFDAFESPVDVFVPDVTPDLELALDSDVSPTEGSESSSFPVRETLDAEAEAPSTFSISELEEIPETTDSLSAAEMGADLDVFAADDRPNAEAELVAESDFSALFDADLADVANASPPASTPERNESAFDSYGLDDVAGLDGLLDIEASSEAIAETQDAAPEELALSEAETSELLNFDVNDLGDFSFESSSEAIAETQDAAPEELALSEAETSELLNFDVNDLGDFSFESSSEAIAETQDAAPEELALTEAETSELLNFDVNDLGDFSFDAEVKDSTEASAEVKDEPATPVEDEWEFDNLLGVAAAGTAVATLVSPASSVPSDAIASSESGAEALDHSLEQVDEMAAPAKTDASGIHLEPVISVPQLRQLAGHADSTVRQDVAESVLKITAQRKLRAELKPIIPVLGRLSQDAVPQVRSQAVQALGSIQSVAVLPFLRRALRDTAPEVAQSAAIAIRQVKPVTSKAVKAVVKRTKR